MQAFAFGPFTFEPASRGLKLNNENCRRWTLRYGDREVAAHTLPETLTQDEIRDEFAPDLAAFRLRAQREHAPDELHLIDYNSDKCLAVIAVDNDPGLTPGLIDDRSQFWLRSQDRRRSLNVTLSQFAQIADRHAAPPLSWIAGLLPDDVLTRDREAWRAPTGWEIRHIVGEGSFTGVSGAKAAALVGVTPQNFRKYTARDDASTRQQMSFARWHLLLHKLGVQRA